MGWRTPRLSEAGGVYCSEWTNRLICICISLARLEKHKQQTLIGHGDGACRCCTLVVASTWTVPPFRPLLGTVFSPQGERVVSTGSCFPPRHRFLMVQWVGLAFLVGWIGETVPSCSFSGMTTSSVGARIDENCNRQSTQYS